MQAGRWNATKSIGTTFMRIWRVVFWESEFFEKASQKKKKKTRSHLEKKKRFHNTCLINQTGIWRGEQIDNCEQICSSYFTA